MTRKPTVQVSNRMNEDSGKQVEENGHRFEIHTDSNSHDWERIETKEDKIALE